MGHPAADFFGLLSLPEKRLCRRAVRPGLRGFSGGGGNQPLREPGKGRPGPVRESGGERGEDQGERYQVQDKRNHVEFVGAFDKRLDFLFNKNALVSNKDLVWEFR